MTQKFPIRSISEMAEQLWMHSKYLHPTQTFLRLLKGHAWEKLSIRKSTKETFLKPPAFLKPFSSTVGQNVGSGYIRQFLIIEISLDVITSPKPGWNYVSSIGWVLILCRKIFLANFRNFWYLKNQAQGSSNLNIESQQHSIYLKWVLNESLRDFLQDDF